MTPTELSNAAGISVSHASMILSDDRKPSLRVALSIYDTTGLQFGPLAGLSRSAVDELREQQRKAA